MSCSSRLEKTCPGNGESRTRYSSLHEVIALTSYSTRSTSQYWASTLTWSLTPQPARMSFTRPLTHP
jgi:hypothetical protein